MSGNGRLKTHTALNPERSWSWLAPRATTHHCSHDLVSGEQRVGMPSPGTHRNEAGLLWTRLGNTNFGVSLVNKPFNNRLFQTNKVLV